jgi:hypothetical protein
MDPAEGSRVRKATKERIMKALWEVTKKDLHPVLTGTLLGFLLIPGSLVWALLAGATIALIAIRYAVPATAVVSAKSEVAVDGRRLQ